MFETYLFGHEQSPFGHAHDLFAHPMQLSQTETKLLIQFLQYIY